MPNLAAAMTLALVLLPSREANASGAGGLKGTVPRDKPPVGSVALPEVHAGRPDLTFHFQAAPGHILFVYFGYTTCPDVCPTTLSDLHHALRSLGDAARRVDVSFVTVDPQRDVPGVLEPYLAAFVRDAHPLRPRTQDQLVAAERAFGASSTVTRNADGVVEVSHSATSYLVDERGRIVDTWGFGTTPAAMTADLRILLKLAKPQSRTG